MNERLINDYKNLHQIPEEGFCEFKTHQYILTELEKLNCTIYELKPTGIIAFFNYEAKETIAFRCEMDGLLIEEKNSFTYNSIHKGMMHACGHDGHMAILLEFGRSLTDIKCPKNICLIFQPSEEVYGGALKVLESDFINLFNVKEIYGLHLWPSLKKGTIASKSKNMMASSTEIDITIYGKESHVASKEEGVDAIDIAYKLLNGIHDEEVLFHCGKITSTGMRNIVCGKVELYCTLRSFYKIKRKNFISRLNELAKKLSTDYNVKIEIDSKKYIPSLNNDLCLFEKHRHLVDEVTSAVYQAEDFAFYSEKCKSLFFFLGIGDVSPLHSNELNFDLNILEKGVKLFTQIARTR